MDLPEKRKNIKTQNDVGIFIKDGAFGWKTGEKPVITGINLELRAGELCIVIGTVGSGKTTLLHALMNENVKIAGDHDQNGTLAYVEQEPFIFSASVKENIVLGRDWNE
jgi:ABC-type transport system involved in cytochrome bd biosynthesis fused ATPase/permease subunit